MHRLAWLILLLMAPQAAAGTPLAHGLAEPLEQAAASSLQPADRDAVSPTPLASAGDVATASQDAGPTSFDRLERSWWTGALLAGTMFLLGRLAWNQFVAPRPWPRADAIMASVAFLAAIILAKGVPSPIGPAVPVAVAALAAAAMVPFARGWSIAVAVAAALLVAKAGNGDRSVFDLFIQGAHIIFIGIWVGGLPDAWRHAVYRDHVALRKFTRLAVVGLVAMVLTGSALGISRLGHVSHLWRTTYGTLLLVKLAWVLAVVILGQWNNRRVRTGDPLARTVLAEAAAVLVVIVISGMLANVPVPGDQALP